MRSNQYRSSPASIYMLSVTDFDQRGTISDVWVHAVALFWHTGCRSIATCSRYSTKFSRSFDHHGKTKKELFKNSFEKSRKITWTSSEICEKSWLICSRLRMRGCQCAILKREVGNLRNVRQREVGRSNKSTRCVPSYCAGQVWGGEGHIIVVCGAPWPTAWWGTKFHVLSVAKCREWSKGLKASPEG